MLQQQQHTSSLRWQRWARVPALSRILEIIGVNAPVCSLCFSSLFVAVADARVFEFNFSASSCLSSLQLNANTFKLLLLSDDRL